MTQWKYGKRGARHYFEHDGREITATFKPPQDDLVRLTVEVPDDCKLYRFVKWPKRPKHRAATWTYRFPHVRLWWVYLGRLIAPATLPTRVSRRRPSQCGKSRATRGLICLQIRHQSER